MSGRRERRSVGQRFNEAFSAGFERAVGIYRRSVTGLLSAPALALVVFVAAFGVSLLLFPRARFVVLPEN